MVDDGLVICPECDEQFSKGDHIIECSSCNEIFCSDCWKEHCCTDDDFEEISADCSECGETEGASDLKECPDCNKDFCSSCQEEHAHKHLDDEKIEHDYEEYAEKKIRMAI